MPTKFKILAAVAALAAGTSSAAMAQYARSPGYSNPVSGEAAGAASGYATGGAVGAVVGGALGTATGAVTGTANMLAPPASGCYPGYTYRNGACYPVR